MQEITIVSPNYPASEDFKITLEIEDGLTEEQIKQEIIKELRSLNIKIDEQNIEKLNGRHSLSGIRGGNKSRL